jgi:hypothetical protein
MLTKTAWQCVSSYKPCTLARFEPATSFAKPFILDRVAKLVGSFIGCYEKPSTRKFVDP